MKQERPEIVLRPLVDVDYRMLHDVSGRRSASDPALRLDKPAGDRRRSLQLAFVGANVPPELAVGFGGVDCHWYHCHAMVTHLVLAASNFPTASHFDIERGFR